MKIAIKNPAPLGPSLEKWGDFHFGASLEAAIRRLGMEVSQHFWPDWGRDGEDAAIWLRGKRRAVPEPNVVNAIWILSHPATVTPSELEGFDLVFAGSEKLASHLEDQNVRGVKLLRQCTDDQIFKGNVAISDADRKGLLFLASSRGVRRPVLEWALEAGFTPTLIGQGWRQVGHGDLVSSGHVPNTLLPELYASARYGMNDHWGDMAHYQIINNRIFDSMACGLPVISDGFPELAEIAGDGVWVVDGPRSFRDAYWAIRLDYGAARQACEARWRAISSQYTFDARARDIVQFLSSAPLDEHRRAGTTGGPLPVLKRTIKHLVDRLGETGTKSSKTSPSLLHVFPEQETSGALAAIQSLSVVSAGLGAGPWNMRLDLGPCGLGDRKFDGIFIDGGDAARCAGKADKMPMQLVKLLKRGGIIAAEDPLSLASLHSNPNVTLVCGLPPIYRRTSDQFIAPTSPSVHMASYRND